MRNVAIISCLVHSLSGDGVTLRSGDTDYENMLPMTISVLPERGARLMPDLTMREH